MTLAAKVEQIDSREDLVRFIRELRSDLEAFPTTWENNELSTYLGSVAAWLDDMDGYYYGRGETAPESPEWKTLGQIFLAAKHYE